MLLERAKLPWKAPGKGCPVQVFYRASKMSLNAQDVVHHLAQEALKMLLDETKGKLK